MDFLLEDQLINGFQLGTLTNTVSEPTLISDVMINTLIFGISYYNGVLTVNDEPLLMGSSDIPTEAYVDDNKILKLR